MYSPDYEKRLLQYCSPTARSLYQRTDGADAGGSSSSVAPQSLDRFIPCR